VGVTAHAQPTASAIISTITDISSILFIYSCLLGNMPGKLF
jgi:hypothetical protein